MKWCNNCQAYRESWAEKGYSGENYDNRCLYCANYNLNSNPIVIGDPPDRNDCEVLVVESKSGNYLTIKKDDNSSYNSRVDAAVASALKYADESGGHVNVKVGEYETNIEYVPPQNK
jgi:pyruvate-formate lyase-activating enzyme